MTFVNVIESWHENDGYIFVTSKFYEDEISAKGDIDLFLEKCREKCTSTFIDTCKTVLTADEIKQIVSEHNSLNMPLETWKEGDWARAFISRIMQ